MIDVIGGNDKILIKRIRKQEGKFSEIRIDKDGKVFIDGEPYDENNPHYKGIFVSSERHEKIETGEETQKMIEESKKAVKGDTVVITDINTPEKKQKTIVKF